MSALCVTMCKPCELSVDNSWLSTHGETTNLQDVINTPTVYTGTNRIYAGPKLVNPQSTALITVISYLYGSPHPTIANFAKQNTHQKVRSEYEI
ncbi:hypothetical protein LBMAG16_08880 [Actinomycetes bacterium]|nr:hypothetical protein LBMAG16_08880 [Actinomycetes bacterium]